MRVICWQNQEIDRRLEVHVAPPMEVKRPRGGAGRTLTIRSKKVGEPRTKSQPTGSQISPPSNAHIQLMETEAAAAQSHGLDIDEKLTMMLRSIQRLSSEVAALGDQRLKGSGTPRRKPTPSFKKTPIRRIDRDRSERLVRILRIDRVGLRLIYIYRARSAK
jgi:hypothetical protein